MFFRKKTLRYKGNYGNFILKIICLIFLFMPVRRSFPEIIEESKTTLDIKYFNSKNQLKDYILDTGDQLRIEFDNAPEISGLYTIDSEGEIFFKRIKGTYVRGLTLIELEKLLENRYSEFLVKPDVYIRIIKFKPIKVAISGEVRNPGIFKFKYSILENQDVSINRELSEDNNDFDRSPGNISTTITDIFSNTESVISISNLIKKANGLTPYSDVSRIEIIRNVPLGEGGGKKRAIIDLTGYLNGEISSNQDIRLFNGDLIKVPKLNSPDSMIVLKSIISGLSPKFVSVYISGQTENPGKYLLPLEGTLSDAMNLSAPRKPLSGKIYLIRYKRDGSLLRENIKYSSKAKPGSKRNPYLKSGDYITIQKSTYGRMAETITAVTEPFSGIYASKLLIESLLAN